MIGSMQINPDWMNYALLSPWQVFRHFRDIIFWPFIGDVSTFLGQKASALWMASYDVNTMAKICKQL